MDGLRGNGGPAPPPQPPGNSLHIHLNGTICTVCGLCYLLYQHYVSSPSMTHVSLRTYGGNSSLFNLLAESRGAVEPGRALVWISATQTGFHRAYG